MKKFLFFFLFLFSFLFCNKAFATYYIDQSNWVMDNYTNTPDKTGSSYDSRNFCQSFIPQENNIAAIGFAVAKNNVQFCDQVAGFGGAGFSLSATGCFGTTLATATTTLEYCQNNMSSSTPSIMMAYFNDPVSVSPGQTYYIYNTPVQGGSGGMNQDSWTIGFSKYGESVLLGQTGYFGFGIQSPNDHINGPPGTLPSYTKYPNASFTFQEYYSDEASSTTTEAFVINPVQEDTAESNIWTGQEFTGFVMENYNLDVSFQFQLLDSDGVSILSESNWSLPANTFATSSPFSMVQGKQPFNYTFVEGTYWVKTRARFNWENSITEWSSPVRFYSTAQVYYETCDLADIWCNTKNIFSWALIPTSDSTSAEAYDQILEIFNTKIPFAYFSDAYSIYETIADTSVSSSTTSLSAPIVFQNINVNMPIFDTSTSEVSDFTNTVRPFFISGLWLCFLSYIFFRLSSLKL